MPELAERLKTCRKELRYTQKQMVEAVGSKLPSWRDYEAGKRTPGGKVLKGLANININVNWVLTGKGSMMLEESPVLSSPDSELLGFLIESVEGVLEESDREMAPSNKANLIMALYELYSESHAKPDREKILRLVHSAA